MTQEQVLDRVLSALERCGISFMITGSLAGNLHGIPRATQDANVVIEANRPQIERFIADLGTDFYASLDAALDAVSRKEMFNVIHLETGFKIDLIARKSRAFSHEEFSRRRPANVSGQARWFASPEDVILSKLEWSMMGNSERQFLDALNVARVQTGSLDRGYLTRWAVDLGIAELLERLLRELDT